MRKVTCCISGSRPQSLPWGFDEADERCKNFKKNLKYELVKIIDRGYTHFIGGMALGTDQYAFEILFNYKNYNPDKQIFLEAAIPCETQAVWWKETQRNRYFDIIKNVDKETLMSKKYYSYQLFHSGFRFRINRFIQPILGKKVNGFMFIFLVI